MHLTLFITAGAPGAARHEQQARTFAEQYLSGRYDLCVVDVRAEPGVAAVAGIAITPTLICEGFVDGTPSRRAMGDLSDTDGVARALVLSPIPMH